MNKFLNELTNEELWQLFPIILVQHDPAWKERYIEEERLLRASIGSKNIVWINHIGSTAVPNLTAKPTIDILLEIAENTDLKQLQNMIESTGYIYSEQPDNPPPYMMFMKGYTPEGFQGQAFHLHIRYASDWDELYFRDYLLTHPETAEAYGALKLELQKQYKHDRDTYTEAKTDFIKQFTIKARGEFDGRYKHKK